MFRPIVATQLQKVIELAYKINDVAQLESVPRNLPAVVIKFDGAGGWLDVWIYPDGKYELPMRHIFKDVNLSKDDAYLHLDELINILEIMKDNKYSKETRYDGK